MSVMLVRQQGKERRDAAAGAAVRDRFATLTRAARRPGPPPPPPRPCSRLAGQRIGRCSMCSTPAVEQDEVVEDNLDARMPFAGRGILPAQRMEPASNVDAAAFTHVLGADLGQGPHATQRVHSVASCAWPSASFQCWLVATLNVVRAVPVAVYVTAGSCPRWPMSWTRLRSFMESLRSLPRVKKESASAFRKAKLTKTGVNGARARRSRRRSAFISTLAAEGAKPPSACSRSDSALDAHVSTSERGNTEAIRTA